MKIYVLLFLLAVSSSLVSQKPAVIDSLKDLLKKNVINDTNKVKRLYNIGGTYYYENLDSSMVYINKGLELAKKINSLKWTGAGYCAMAGAYSLGDKDSLAEINYKKAIDILKDLPIDKALLSAYGGLASILSRQGNYEESIRLRFLQIELAEKTKQEDQQAMAYSALAITYKNLQNYDKCLLYMEKSIAIKEQLSDKYSLCMGYINLGGAYHETGQYQKAIVAYEKALALQKLVNQGTFLIKIYQGLCNAFIEIKEYDKSLLFLDKVKVLCEAKNNESNLMDVYISYGIIYMHTKKENLSESFFLKARELAKKIKNANYDLFINEMLYMLYSNTGNYKLALDNYKLFMDETMKQNDVKLKEQIDGLEIKYETSKKEEANRLLTETTKAQEIQIRQGRYITIGVVSFLVLIVFILILVIRQSKLVASQKSMQLEQKLLRSQMNPHFIFNSLTAIESFIYKNEPREAGRYLSGFARLMRLILENSREEFVTLEKEIQTLENYLKLQKLRFEDAFDYTIHISDEIDSSMMEVPPMLAQPFIENAIEHGLKGLQKKGEINVYFSLKNDELVFEVQDNGIGFEKTSTFKNENTDHKSLATTITGERLKNLNKKKRNIKVMIEDIKDHLNNVLGAKVTFTIPFTKG